MHRLVQVSRWGRQEVSVSDGWPNLILNVFCREAGDRPIRRRDVHATGGGADAAEDRFRGARDAASFFTAPFLFLAAAEFSGRLFCE